MRAYLDPQHAARVEEEVEEIMSFADSNRDDSLTLDELLAHANQLLSSSLLHPRSRLHDDL